MRASLLFSSASYSRSQTKIACVEFATVALSDALRYNLQHRLRVLRSVFRAWRWSATSNNTTMKSYKRIAFVGVRNGDQNTALSLPNAVADKEKFGVRLLLSKPRLPVRNVYTVVDGCIVLNSGIEFPSDHAFEALTKPSVVSYSIRSDQHSNNKNNQKLQLVSDILQFIEEFKELL